MAGPYPGQGAMPDDENDVGQGHGLNVGDDAATLTHGPAPPPRMAMQFDRHGDGGCRGIRL